MKFSTTIISFISCSLGLAASIPQPRGPFGLQVESDNSDLDKIPITLLHEGAGINYAFATGEFHAARFTLNDTVLADASPDAQFPYGAIISQTSKGIPVLEVGVLQEPGTDHFSTGFSFTGDGYLQINGSTEGWNVCKDIEDPYNYEYPALAFYKFRPLKRGEGNDGAWAPGCEKVKVKKVPILKD